MDLRFALRSFRKNPGFTALCVLILALGIGASTAVFSVVNAVLLRPLAFRDPGRIVTLSYRFPNRSLLSYVSGPDFHDWHDQASAFSAMAYYTGGEMAVTAGSGAEYATIAGVAPEFFGVFDVQPAMGRFFSAQENQKGPVRAVAISHEFWRNRFGGDPQVLGRTVRLFGESIPVVAVMPAGFRFPDRTDIWLPMTQEIAIRSAYNYRVLGRLKPGTDLAAAQAQMDTIAARLAGQYPDSNKGKTVAVMRLSEEMVGGVRLTLLVLLGAVGLVLLIACSNVAGLMLARAGSRAREIAIRAAVGASRARIVRQLALESVLLALAGGVVGIGLAFWVSDALVHLAPADVPRLAETAVDARVLVFCLGLSVIASVLFGVAPAWHISRVDLTQALNRGASRAGGGRTSRLRRGLVVAEIALSVVLLAGAGLLIRSFVALQNADLGFQPEKILVAETSIPALNLETAKKAGTLYRDVLADIASVPGVSAAGAMQAIPGHVTSYGSYWIDRRPARFTRDTPQAVYSLVAPGTFAALGVPLRRGHDFDGSEDFDAPFTAVVNEALVRKSFGGEDPIGRLVFCGLDSDKPMKIVGVVGDTRQYGRSRAPEPQIYMPHRQHPTFATNLDLLVRSSLDPEALAGTVTAALRRHSPEAAVKYTTMQASLAQGVAAPRFRTMLLGIFAGVAVFLAMAGVYGVMAHAVSLRAGEIGVRVALGASPGDVLRMVLREGLMLALLGLGFGLAGAAAATRLLASLLFEVRPGDPGTYAAVSTLLGLVALAAAYLPARRATRLDPLAALRQD